MSEGRDPPGDIRLGFADFKYCGFHRYLPRASGERDDVNMPFPCIKNDTLPRMKAAQ